MLYTSMPQDPTFENLADAKKVKFAVILAGGSGERFWPASTKAKPKQLLPLTHPHKSMLREAIERVEPLVGTDYIYISTSSTLVDPISCSHPEYSERMLVEPANRSTLGAIVWIAANLANRSSSESTVVIVTADHKIGEPEQFRADLVQAMRVAEDTGAICTLGIKPTRPETGFGYQDTEPSEDAIALRVVKFLEKPDLDSAKVYFASPSFFWNAGMFIFKISSLELILQNHSPKSYHAYQEIRASLQVEDMDRATAAFESLDKKSFDHEVMEKLPLSYVIPASFSWDDVGAWDALSRSQVPDLSGNVVQGLVGQIETQNSILINLSQNLKVGVLGIENMIVVITDDAVMICPRSESQRVREISTIVEQIGKTES